MKKFAWIFATLTLIIFNNVLANPIDHLDIRQPFKSKVIGPKLTSDIKLECHQICDVDQVINAFISMNSQPFESANQMFKVYKNGELIYQITVSDHMDSISAPHIGFIDLPGTVPAPGTNDAALDCRFDTDYSCEDWAATAYAFDLLNYVRNVRIEFVITQDFIDSLKNTTNAAANVSVFALILMDISPTRPVGTISRHLLRKALEKELARRLGLGIEFLAGWALVDLIDAIISPNIQVGDIMVIQDGDSRVYRDGVQVSGPPGGTPPGNSGSGTGGNGGGGGNDNGGHSGGGSGGGGAGGLLCRVVWTGHGGYAGQSQLSCWYP